MTDDEDGAFVIHQEILQPYRGGKIQVVRRLVHQDDIGMAEQRLRQQHLDLLPAFQLRHLLLMQGYRDAKALQQA